MHPGAPEQISGAPAAPQDGHFKRWDKMNPWERFLLIKEHPSSFLSRGLITYAELDRVMNMHESGLEYVVDREDQPFFTSIDLKRELAVQIHREKLEAALKAVFLN